MLPVLLLLLLGMIDFAMVFNGQSVVANAARDGARAASLGKSYASTGTLVQNETSGLANSTTVGWEVCTAETIDATAWNCSSAALGNSTLYDSKRTVNWIVRVTVSYQYTLITPLPLLVGLDSTIPITQSSYMRIENLT